MLIWMSSDDAIRIFNVKNSILCPGWMPILLGCYAIWIKKRPTSVCCHDAWPRVLWTAVAEANGIDTSVHNGATIIIDNNFI
jgi:hypothetical protein